jgi:hypothetical protein
MAYNTRNYWVVWTLRVIQYSKKSVLFNIGRRAKSENPVLPSAELFVPLQYSTQFKFKESDGIMNESVSLSEESTFNLLIYALNIPSE